jgi:hypothetical protein
MPGEDREDPAGEVELAIRRTCLGIRSRRRRRQGGDEHESCDAHQSGGHVGHP